MKTDTHMKTDTDHIQRQIEIQAPRSRVWQAIADSQQLGSWFGLRIEGPFKKGSIVRAKRVPSSVAEPSGTSCSSDAPDLTMSIESIEPENRFSFRWHPFSYDPKYDYSKEPMTLVVFELTEIPGGTRVTVTESGFDALSPARRAEAFPKHEQGWPIQLDRIRRFVGGSR